ncbi:hypothetical protein IWX50DRAFT_188559 [Phyllosticta citricarpa]
MNSTKSVQLVVPTFLWSWFLESSHTTISAVMVLEHHLERFVSLSRLPATELRVPLYSAIKQRRQQQRKRRPKAKHQFIPQSAPSSSLHPVEQHEASDHQHPIFAIIIRTTRRHQANDNKSRIGAKMFAHHPLASADLLPPSLGFRPTHGLGRVLERLRIYPARCHRPRPPIAVICTLTACGRRWVGWWTFHYRINLPVAHHLSTWLQSSFSVLTAAVASPRLLASLDT